MSILGINFEYEERVKGISDFSEDIKKDFIFFALDGESHHGSKHIDDVKKKNPLLIVHNDRNYKSQESNIFFIRDLSEKIIPFLYAFYKLDSDNFKFIGFTGTNGKTSSAFLCHQMLLSIGKSSSYIGTLGFLNNDLNDFVDSKNTTPGIFKIFDFLSNLELKKIHHICLEVSSHALDQNRLRNINLDFSSILNIEEDHLDYHKTKKNYITSKLKIIDITKNNSVLVHSDLKDTILEYRDIDEERILQINTNNPESEIFLNIVKVGFDKSDFILKLENKEYKFSLKLFPRFNIYNFIFAFISVYKLDKKVDLKDLDLKNIYLPKGRMQIVRSVPYKIIIDYAHNTNSFKVLIEPIKKEFNRVIVIFGCGGDRDKFKRPLMLKAAIEYADKVIFTSDNNRSESYSSILKDALVGNDSKKVVAIEDRKEAIIEGCKMLTAETCLLILGKGHEETQETYGVNNFFSDHKVVDEIYQ